MLIVDAGEFVVENPSLLLEAAFTQVLLCGAALGVACAIGLPLGVLTGHLRRYSFIAINGSNVARALPTLAVIAILLTLVGIGFMNIMLALVILALPPIVTNTYVAVASVDDQMLEASRAAGMRASQILLMAELPSAIPLIFTGLRVATLYTLGSGYLASLAGYPGTLGDVIIDQARFGLSGVLGATIVVLLLAFTCDVLLAQLQRVLTPKGVRLTQVRQGATESPLAIADVADRAAVQAASDAATT